MLELHDAFVTEVFHVLVSPFLACLLFFFHLLGTTIIRRLGNQVGRNQLN